MVLFIGRETTQVSITMSVFIIMWSYKQCGPIDEEVFISGQVLTADFGIIFK